jgi:AAA family ATP:ADP antiporter
MDSTERNSGLLTAVAMTAAMLMIAHHIAGKATRDALFLTSFDIAELPKIMIASAAVSVVAVLMMSRALARFGPARLIPPLYFVSGLLLAVQWWLAPSYPQVAAVALYLHISALNAILISGFWSVINERFDPYAAKKAVARLTAATSFGGIVGGLAAKGVASLADTHDILLMLSLMHVVCGLAVGFLARGQASIRQADEPPTQLLGPLKRSALIRRMAILGLLVATTAAVLDYLLKSQASATLSDEELISFFSYFYMLVGLGTFLVQMAVGNKALRWFGLGGSMAAWPLVILMTGTGALLFRSLITVTLMRASANLLYNSFFRAGFELLYTPIAPADKRSGKVLIDVGADRAGDMVGGLLVMLILLLPVGTDSVLYISALVLAGLCLLLILVLHRSYIRQLAHNLRDGRQRPEDIEVVDSTTSATVASTQAAIDRDKLLKEIAELQEKRRAGTSEDEAAEVYPSSRDPVIEAIMVLRGGNEQDIRRVLTSQAMNAALVPHVISLLRDERVLRESMRALGKVASSDAGQLVDALVDPLQHTLIRRRLPLVLARSDSPMALQGLEVGLDDDDWNVRFRCARALESMRRRLPHMPLDQEKLLRHVEHELRAISAGGEKTQRLELVFLLFGAAYEPASLELSWQALQGDDRNLRGTALEYLENLLPMHIWALLQPIVAPGHVARKDKRSLQQAGLALRAAAASLKPKRRQSSDTTSVDGLE